MDSSKIKKIYICSVYNVNKSWNIAIPVFLYLEGGAQYLTLSLTPILPITLRNRLEMGSSIIKKIYIDVFCSVYKVNT